MAKVPNLRFPGFDGEWKQFTLGDITEQFSRRNKNKTDFPMFSVTNARGFVNQQEQFEDREMKGEDIAAYKIVSPGEFAYNPARINVGSIALYNGDTDCMISSLYVCFKARKDLVDSQLLLHILKSPKMVYNYGINGEGGVRIYLFYPNFARIKVKLPSLEEQRKIASFLD
ncbi:MAG: restriction endonuclease subunit S, partial [Bacteroidales bacterium]|nr:restriction endonuclease subunit S [Bacteroidales bacterium]